MWAPLRDALLQQRGRLLLWAPVLLGLGIALYFQRAAEPPPAIVWGIAMAGGILLMLGRWAGDALAPVIWGLGVVALGFGLGAGRAHWVGAPVLGWPYYGAIEGRVIAVDRSSSNAVRITLDQLRLGRISARRTPDKIRLSLHSDQGLQQPEPGMHVRTTGRLSPPSGPVEPGGFDFRRRAWFAGLGAVGYSKTPLEQVAPKDSGGIAGLRYHLARGIDVRIGGAPGALAAAITAGDRSSLPPEVIDDLRASNMAHLLAISGLHMGMLTGFVYLALRFLCACLPVLALRYPTHKFAALGAMAAGGLYLALSGGAVATERAFIMVSMMLVGVIMDRRAITLRAVALAAVIVLILRPESLLGPGFQMSFAATIALVAVFGALRGRLPMRGAAGSVLSVFLSSLVAGLATAPLSAAHFNTVSHYGLLANVISVPVMGAVVMPAAVIAALAEPFGLAAPALWAMEQGLRWILGVAAYVAALPNAVGVVKAPDPLVLPLIYGGAIFAVLWNGRAKALALLPMIAGAFLWINTERPPILIAETGGLVGVMTPHGRALSRATGDSFAAQLWLENDGDRATQAQAAERPAWQRETRVFRTQVGGISILHLRGKTALSGVSGCGGADVLITNSPAGERPCLVIDPPFLDHAGSVALWPGSTGPKVVTATDIAGRRIWNTAR